MAGENCRSPRLVATAVGGLAAWLCTTSVWAWGDKGHEVVALIAYRHLSDKARAALDQLLASDPDTSTRSDFASRATWADRYRTRHRETAAWHYINLEIEDADLETACFHFPASGNLPASLGPPQDCVVNKIEEFSAELKDPHTAPAERLLALRFLIHFVGDLHQPLHAADHDDHGGNCVRLDTPGAGHALNLHAFWDVSVVDALGPNASTIAQMLDRQITAAEARHWSRGHAREWALESFALGKKDAYALPARPTCAARGSVSLSHEYQATAQQDAGLQLKRAAIRLAGVLNKALPT